MNEKEYYKFLFYKAVDTESKDLLKSIPKKYVPDISIESNDMILYSKKTIYLILNMQYWFQKTKFF